MFAPTDPEGIFTTITAFINVFTGIFFSLLMRYNTKRFNGDKSSLLLLWSLLTIVLIIIGYETSAIGDVINKKRWSVSFAFVTSGFSGSVLCLCFALVDIYNKPWIKNIAIKPFLWLGMNPLFIYILMMSYQELIIYNIRFQVNGKKTSLWDFLYDKILGSWITNDYVASTLWGILFLIMYSGIAYLLYRKNIFIKL